MRQLCAALKVAHEKGVIHRDLKPRNILLTAGNGDTLVKVCDFGIAKVMGQQESGESQRETDLTVGRAPWTPGYAAPKQLEGRKVDARTDLFALGIIFYNLVTARNP